MSHNLVWTLTLNDLYWSANDSGPVRWLVTLIVLWIGAGSWLLERAGCWASIGRISVLWDSLASNWAASTWAWIVLICVHLKNDCLEFLFAMVMEIDFNLFDLNWLKSKITKLYRLYFANEQLYLMNLNS